jgi:hypothetical protein
MDEENQFVESMWNIFQTKLQVSIQKNIPQKKARQKDGCFRMFAFSSDCEWSTPLDLSGGMVFPSDFLCLIKVQKRFILFLFVSSCLFIFGVTMSSCMSNIQKGEDI